MLSKELSPDVIKQNLLDGLPENLKNAFERVIIAGMKLFYSKETQAELMEDDGPVEQPMAEMLSIGTVGVMMQLWEASNSTMPPQVMVPAAIYMLSEGSEFLANTGKFEITDADVGKAMELTVVGILHKFGIDGAKAQELAQQVAGQAQGGQDIKAPTGLLSKGGA